MKFLHSDLSQIRSKWLKEGSSFKNLVQQTTTLIHKTTQNLIRIVVTAFKIIFPKLINQKLIKTTVKNYMKVYSKIKQ